MGNIRFSKEDTSGQKTTTGYQRLALTLKKDQKRRRVHSLIKQTNAIKLKINKLRRYEKN